MRIGVIGAGQLGQMLGFAARELNYSCVFLDPADSPPAALFGPVIQAAYDDRHALARLAADCDIVTFEFENVPVDALEQLGSSPPVYPPPDALRQAQDRLAEKRLFSSLDMDLPDYRTVDSRDDLEQAATTIGLPLVLKARRFGYDGKGQYVIKEQEQLLPAWNALGGSPLIAEQWVAFDFEVSVIGVRNADGETAIYPLSRNEHRDGILHCSRAPVDDGGLTDLARDYVTRLLGALDYVGVLALELFVVGERLLANEFAPRVHNSGHWTIEGAQTSQFRNHLLAVSNQPPGPTTMTAFAGMVNLVGDISQATRALDIGILHDYGKTPRPGRKLGHITVTAASAAERDRLIDLVEQHLDHPA